MVFNAKYLIPCANALQSLEPALARSYHRDLLLDFHRQSQAVRSGNTSADLRFQCLYLLSKRMATIKSNTTCLCCLTQLPEHELPCGHSLCDQCLLIFADELESAEYHFSLNSCLLCQAQIGFRARLKPPTAGVRVLSIDGGGTRGVIPLESLCLLQSLLGDVPVRDCFELGMGTSSGK